MGGTISVSSQIAQGSQFFIRIPAIIPNKNITTQPALNSRIEFSNQTLILLVEDQPANQEMIAMQIHSLGLRCLIVGDGLQALQVATHNDDIKFILMDCHLPEMDGYQAAERIRTHEQLTGKTRRPIIAISAKIGEAHRKQCLESGMDDVLCKPLQLASLQTLLLMWLPSLPTPPIDSPQMEDHSLWLTFIECNEKDHAQATQAIAQADWESALYYIHRIKGAAQTMQIQSISLAASALESAINQHSPECLNLLHTLRAALDDFTHSHLMFPPNGDHPPTQA
ncbi:Sensor kinase protein RcsC [Chromobacterium vaccinii]|nr:Sensor kinase protein RcsC [Chromobacterium vaccinii]